MAKAFFEVAALSIMPSRIRAAVTSLEGSCHIFGQYESRLAQETQAILCRSSAQTAATPLQEIEQADEVLIRPVGNDLTGQAPLLLRQRA